MQFVVLLNINSLNENITLDEVKNGFYECWMEGIKDRKITLTEYPIEDFLNCFLQKFKLIFNLNQCIEAINLFYTEYREQVYFQNNISNTLKSIKDKGYKIGAKSKVRITKGHYLIRLRGDDLFCILFNFSYKGSITKYRMKLYF